jgi:hypothetical protein
MVRFRAFARAVVLSVAPIPLGVQAQGFPDLPAPLAEKVEAARQACAYFEDGSFALEWGAVSRVDLDGDIYRDWVLDEAAFACSSAASLYCGTGGCVSHFLIGDRVTSIQNKGWTMVTFGRDRVLLTDVHGSDCGGINPTPCVVAYVWDGEVEAWRTVKAGAH